MTSRADRTSSSISCGICAIATSVSQNLRRRRAIETRGARSAGATTSNSVCTRVAGYRYCDVQISDNLKEKDENIPDVANGHL